MIIGELFFNIGVKGSDKTKESLGDVEKGLKGIGSMSIEAKAAIIGAVYALEQLFAKSGAAGTNLSNYNALFGGSVKTLQQYQYAARQVGVSNEETESTFKSLADQMQKTRLGLGQPGGIGQVHFKTGSFSAQEVQRFETHPEELIQKLQKYAQSEKDAGLRNQTLKTFGLSDNFISALTKKKFTPESFGRAPTYSEKEIGQLDKANIAWSNLGAKIDMAIGHFNALHGGEIVGDISKLVPEVLKLVNAFLKLADSVKLFTGIGKIFEGWAAIFSGITTTVDTLTGAAKDPKKAASLKESTSDFVHDLPSMFKVMGEGVMDQMNYSPEVATGERQKMWDNYGRDAPTQHNPLPSHKETITNNTSKSEKEISTSNKEVSRQILTDKKDSSRHTSTERVTNKEKVTNNWTNQKMDKSKPSSLRLVVPPSPMLPKVSSFVPKIAGPTHNNKVANHTYNVNQSLHFANDGKNSKATGDTVKKAVLDAFRQLPSQVQGS